MIKKKYNSIVKCISFEVVVCNTLDEKNIYTAQAIVDTGATDICINENVADALNIVKIGDIKMNTANGSVICKEGLINISIDGEEVKHLSVVVLPDMETEMLLGMNYLSLGNMEINTDNGYTEFVFEKRD